MGVPTTREQLKDWCMRQLGWPVIQINVDDDQVEDRIDEALQYFQEFNYNGVERWYLAHQITAQDKVNRYVEVSDQIIGITRIFPMGSTNAKVNMFDLRYQLRLHELYDFTNTSYVGYTLTQQHIRTLDLLFSGEQPIRYNRHTNKVYLDMNWDNLQEGEYVMLEGYIIIDPETYSDVYNDRMLKKLATAYIKRQWGSNVKKYTGMQTAGGLAINGQLIFDEAMAEIKEIEDQIRDTFEEPPMFIIG